MTENTPEQTPTEPAQAPSWDELFKDQDPVKVREALENSRKWEQRAKDNFEKARKFDEVQEQSKSELEKAQERAAELEKRATLAEQVALKTRIAAEMNVPIEVLHGDNEESIRAAAQRVIEWRDSNKPPPPSPRRLKSGSTSSADSALDGKERAAAALRQLRGN
jgi:hypothetical protein